MLRKFLFYSVRVCTRLIDLIDCYDNRNACRLRMADGLDGLRHNAVVCCNNEYCNICNMCSAGTHCREGFVTRRIEEHDFLSVDHDFGCTDVLRDSA